MKEDPRFDDGSFHEHVTCKRENEDIFYEVETR